MLVAPCREEQLRRELDDLVIAASAVQTAEAGLAVAETSGEVLKGAPPIKVRSRQQAAWHAGVLQWVPLYLWALVCAMVICGCSTF